MVAPLSSVVVQEPALYSSNPAQKHVGTFRFVDPLSEEDWDCQVAHFGEATFFHSRAWAKVLHSAYRFRPLYLVSGSAQVPDAIIPWMEVDSFLTGRRGISLPFSDNCEPLLASGEQFAQIWNRVTAHAGERPWRYV